MLFPQDFKLKNGKFDISLIPDIYDCIKYDVQHNRWVPHLDCEHDNFIKIQLNVSDVV